MTDNTFPLMAKKQGSDHCCLSWGLCVLLFPDLQPGLLATLPTEPDWDSQHRTSLQTWQIVVPSYVEVIPCRMQSCCMTHHENEIDTLMHIMQKMNFFFTILSLES
jgi:hypothetical protein